MNIEVRYLSKSGNTKKLADAIAGELGITAKPITQTVPANTDILFLGGAVYWGGIDGELKKFIATLGGKVKKVAVFSTAALAPSAYPQMRKLITAQHVTVLEKEFHCRGEFMKIHNGRPNAKDLRLAGQFARETVKNSV
jgi:flavodoxin